MNTDKHRLKQSKSLGFGFKKSVSICVHLWFLFAFILTAVHAHQDQHGLSVTDGDTFKIQTEIKLKHITISGLVTIRLGGVDTPELKGKCDREKELAKKAKAFLQTTLETAKTIEIKNPYKGKFFRVIADVLVDGQNLADLIIKAGHGRPYSGKGARGSWCHLGNHRGTETQRGK